MGVSYYAHAIIGVKIDPNKLYEKRIVKAFPHDCPESMKFDPQTGKALWREDLVSVTGVNQDRFEELSVAGHPVVFGTNRKSAFIAGVHARTDYRNEHEARCPLLGVDVRAAMRTVLEPLGFWDEAAFGLWTVLYCSH